MLVNKVIYKLYGFYFGFTLYYTIFYCYGKHPLSTFNMEMRRIMVKGIDIKHNALNNEY